MFWVEITLNSRLHLPHVHIESKYTMPSDLQSFGIGFGDIPYPWDMPLKASSQKHLQSSALCNDAFLPSVEINLISDTLIVFIDYTPNTTTLV